MKINNDFLDNYLKVLINDNGDKLKRVFHPTPVDLYADKIKKLTDEVQVTGEISKLKNFIDARCGEKELEELRIIIKEKDGKFTYEVEGAEHIQRRNSIARITAVKDNETVIFRSFEHMLEAVTGLKGDEAKAVVPTSKVDFRLIDRLRKYYTSQGYSDLRVINTKGKVIWGQK